MSVFVCFLCPGESPWCFETRYKNDIKQIPDIKAPVLNYSSAFHGGVFCLFCDPLPGCCVGVFFMTTNLHIL